MDAPTFVHPLYICTPPYVYMPPYICTPLGSVHNPPGVPHALCALAWFWSIACCVGGVFLLNVYWDTPPLFGGASPLITPPTLHCWFSVHFYSQGYQFLCGFSPSMDSFGGVPPFTRVLGGTLALQLFICSFVL